MAILYLLGNEECSGSGCVNGRVQWKSSADEIEVGSCGPPSWDVLLPRPSPMKLSCYAFPLVILHVLCGYIAIPHSINLHTAAINSYFTSFPIATHCEATELMYDGGSDDSW